MSRKYKFLDNDKPDGYRVYFISFATVHWIANEAQVDVCARWGLTPQDRMHYIEIPSPKPHLTQNSFQKL